MLQDNNISYKDLRLTASLLTIMLVCIFFLLENFILTDPIMQYWHKINIQDKKIAGNNSGSDSGGGNI